MEFKTYKKRINLKHCFVAAACSALILVPITVNTTRAKYSTSESVPLTRGTVNYKVYDFKIMAMYQENDSGEYDEVEVMPTSDYVINEDKSYCYTTTQEEHDDTVVLRTDSAGNHEFGNLKKNSKCYLWFDEKPYDCSQDSSAKACKTLIANAASVAEMPAITGVSSDTSNAMYRVADDNGTSYVFRGNPSNNWVQFGGFYWRIIRVNGDGSVRLIYNGTSTTTTGTGTQISGMHTYSYNGLTNDNAYLGFMYGTTGASTYEATHANTNASNIKTQLDSWYTSSGLSSYASYIDTNAGFCNDRKPASVAATSYGTLGYGTNATVYGAGSRFLTWSGTTSYSWAITQTPTLKCSQADSDLFTPTGSNKGNKKLTNPVGLITADEVVFAGGFGGTENSSYYLYTNQAYWTMSPSYMASGVYASVLAVYSSGALKNLNVRSTSGVRPVINLKSDVTLTGEGTSSSPFTIS